MIIHQALITSKYVQNAQSRQGKFFSAVLHKTLIKWAVAIIQYRF